MKCVYPLLSTPDLLFFRLRGAGLGNNLHVLARSIKFAYEYNALLIAPTQLQFKLRTLFSPKHARRMYGEVFLDNKFDVSGWRKFLFLLYFSRFRAKSSDGLLSRSDFLLMVEGLGDEFLELENYREVVLIRMNNLINPMYWRQARMVIPSGRVGAIHIRRGDFKAGGEVAAAKQGSRNVSIPISWYQEALLQVNLLACVDSWILFSDADLDDHEIYDFCKENGVNRVSAGSAMGDMLAISLCSVVIPSASSFSQWAHYLGSSIAYIPRGIYWSNAKSVSSRTEFLD